MPKYDFKELSDREWLLLRPHNIIGAVQEVDEEGFLLQGDKFVWTSYKYVPGFLKIINEIIDNSVDAYIKSGKKLGNKIEITITKDTVKVKDNGTGIPVEKQGDHYIPFLAWGRPRAGTNFDDEKNIGSMGMNGVGSYATAVFSKQFIGKTCDGKNKLTVKFKDNLEKSEVSKPQKCRIRGTEVEFKPDLERFGLQEIEDIYKVMVKQRLMHIGFSYPGITFKFNGEEIKVDQKSYFSKFHPKTTLFKGNGYYVAVAPNETGEFKYFTYVNGLHVKEGGNHINLFAERISGELREKLAKRHKNIKPADVKSKITLIVIFTDFKQPKFSGQNKERFTSTNQQILTHCGNIDFKKWGEFLFKNKDLVNPIIEEFKFREAYREKQELEKLKKTKKKIKSDKYYSPTKQSEYLLICEGQSASSGLMPALGRDKIGYFELKGKPLNAYDNTQQKFRANEELSTLFQIIQNEVELRKSMEGTAWFEIEYEGKKFVANENDEVYLDGEWVSVKNILEELDGF